MSMIHSRSDENNRQEIQFNLQLVVGTIRADPVSGVQLLAIDESYQDKMGQLSQPIIQIDDRARELGLSSAYFSPDNRLRGELTREEISEFEAFVSRVSCGKLQAYAISTDKLRDLAEQEHLLSQFDGFVDEIVGEIGQDAETNEALDGDSRDDSDNGELT